MSNKTRKVRHTSTLTAEPPVPAAVQTTSCGSCRYWRRKKDPDGVQTDYGSCTYGPPGFLAGHLTTHGLLGIFPVVPAYELCGRHEPLPTPTDLPT